MDVATLSNTVTVEAANKNIMKVYVWRSNQELLWDSSVTGFGITGLSIMYLSSVVH